MLMLVVDPQMVSGPRDHAQLEGLHQVHRHLVGGLHPGGDALQQVQFFFHRFIFQAGNGIG